MAPKNPKTENVSEKRSTDDAALELLRDIARRKADIAQAERSSWKTNGQYSYSGTTLNLHVAGADGDVTQLVLIGGQLLRLDGDFELAATTLGVEKPPALKIGGYVVSDWLADVRTRISKVQLKAKKEKLEKLEARANAILTPEMKARLELEALSAELD